METRKRWWDSYVARTVLLVLGIIVGLCVVAAILWLIARCAQLIAPFILALILCMIMEPIIRLLRHPIGKKQRRMPRKIAAVIAMLLVISAVLFLVSWLLVSVYGQIRDLAITLSRDWPIYQRTVTEWMAQLTASLDFLPEEFVQSMSGWLAEIGSMVLSFVRGIANRAWSTATMLPQALIFVIFSLVGTFWLAADREKILGMLGDAFPKPWREQASSARTDLFSALFGYLRAQLIIMCAIFSVLFAGLSIAGARYALLMALIIAVLDALPAIGAGMVLLPWSAFNFLVGETRLGIALLLMYIVGIVVRNLLEPRLVSGHIGLHPLVTMMAMYAGFRIVGLLGFLLGPMLVLIARNLYRTFARGRSLRQILDNVLRPQASAQKKRE